MDAPSVVRSRALEAGGLGSNPTFAAFCPCNLRQVSCHLCAYVSLLTKSR